MKLFDHVDSDQHHLVTLHDFQGMDFVWYTSPVCHYDIENIYLKIYSFDQLEYYAEVYLFLNPDVNIKIFKGLFCWVGNRENGKTIRTYGKARIEKMISDVYSQKKTPWCRRMRRVVFNPDKIMSAEEKMSVTAQIVSKSVTYTKKDIVSVLDFMYKARMVATQENISDQLGCSKRTIQRLLSKNLRKVMSSNNLSVKREIKIEKAIEWIDVLSSEGEELKMRYLKDVSKIRDYSVLKEAINRYERQL